MYPTLLWNLDRVEEIDFKAQITTLVIRDLEKLKQAWSYLS